MKKLVICLLAVVFTAQLNAQAPDIVHGINAGVSSNNYLYYDAWNDNKMPIAPLLGYYLDVHMRGRTWLFMQFNFAWQKIKYNNSSNQSYAVQNSLDLSIPIRFAFRLGKEDAKFTFYPTAGFGVYVPVYYKYRSGSSSNYAYGTWFESVEDDFPFYPLLNIGFEAKWRYSNKHNVAIGFNSNYLVAENTFYLKFGWNKYKKEKKTKE